MFPTIALADPRRLEELLSCELEVLFAVESSLHEKPALYWKSRWRWLHRACDHVTSRQHLIRHYRRGVDHAVGHNIELPHGYYRARWIARWDEAETFMVVCFTTNDPANPNISSNANLLINLQLFSLVLCLSSRVDVLSIYRPSILLLSLSPSVLWLRI